MLLQVSSCDVQLLGKAEQVEGHWPAARPVTTSRTAKVAATTTTAGFILSFEMHRWVRSGRPEWQVWHTAARESHCSSGGSQFGFTRSPGHAFQLANQNHSIIQLKLLKLFSSSTSLPTHGLYRKFTSRTMENAHGNTADGVENDLELAGDVVLDRLDADLLEDLGEHDLFLLEGN